MTFPVLMYHAIPSSAAEDFDADARYSVATDEFERQLDQFAKHGIQVRSLAALCQQIQSDANLNDATQAVVLTFDDGHVTNYSNALSALADRQMTATFYVNSATVGTPGYATWTQLREMAEQGMSIQSHGHTHTYFDDLTNADAETHLRTSKQMIEENVGQPVTEFAPPGGRLNDNTGAIALSLGYEKIVFSQPGLWNGADNFVPRLPILNVHSTNVVVKLARADFFSVQSRRVFFSLRQVAKQAMGNAGYDKLRRLILR